MAMILVRYARRHNKKVRLRNMCLHWRVRVINAYVSLAEPINQYVLVYAARLCLCGGVADRRGFFLDRSNRDDDMPS